MKNLNKNIIIVIVVIILAIIATFAFVHTNGKMDTQITFKSNASLNNGEQIQFELKDSQGKAISGATVDINFNNEKYSVTTNQDGKGSLTIDGKNAGKYEVSVQYAGDDKHNGCNAKTTITIEGGTADNSASQTSNASNASTSNSNSSDTRPAVDSGGITREEADKYGWEYTSEHGGHYIGPNDHWDPNSQSYHD